MKKLHFDFHETPLSPASWDALIKGLESAKRGEIKELFIDWESEETMGSKEEFQELCECVADPLNTLDCFSARELDVLAKHDPEIAHRLDTINQEWKMLANYVRSRLERK